MDDFRQEWLGKGNLNGTLALAEILGDDWDEEMLRYAYQIAITKILTMNSAETINVMIGLEGKTQLTLVDNQHYLYENIDIWTHEVYASEKLMADILNEMRVIANQKR